MKGLVGLIGILTVASVALKLTGTIAWPWLWVVAPTWIPLFAVIAGKMALGGIIFVGRRLKKRKRKKELEWPF